MTQSPKALSIFIDESGDFGAYDPKCPYYIISLVFHNQMDDMSALFQSFDRALDETALRRNFVHMGPLIRREYEYSKLSVAERLQIYRRTKAFIEKAKFSYQNFIVEKKHIETSMELTTKLAQQITNFIRQHYQYFIQFDKVKVYYDNGQDGVAKIIMAVFTALFNNPDIKVAKQEDYKMLQAADFVCTAALTELKMNRHDLSRSERHILGDDKMIYKYMLKPLKKKKFQE